MRPASYLSGIVCAQTRIRFLVNFRAIRSDRLDVELGLLFRAGVFDKPGFVFLSAFDGCGLFGRVGKAETGTSSWIALGNGRSCKAREHSTSARSRRTGSNAFECLF